MMLTTTIWPCGLDGHPGAVALDRARAAIRTDALYKAMASRTWYPCAAPEPMPRFSSSAWTAAVRRLHRQEPSEVRVSHRRGMTTVWACIGDAWLVAYLPRKNGSFLRDAA